MTLLRLDRWHGESVFELPSIDPPRHVDFTVYERSPTAVTPDGGIEFELTLSQALSANAITFPFVSKNLAFHWQGPLTDDYSKADCDVWTPTYVKLTPGHVDTEVWRPEHVVNSWAVYHPRLQGNQYKAGKVMHIYRPKLVDRTGRTAWGDLTINAKASTMTLTLPTSWLGVASYPVTVDPTFGREDVGGSTANGGKDYMQGYAQVNNTGPGRPYNVSLYAKSSDGGDRNTVCALYDDNAVAPNNKMSDSSAAQNCVAQAWYDFPIANCEPVTANGTLYWVGTNHDTGNLTRWQDNVAANWFQYVSCAYPGLTDPFNPFSIQARSVSAHVDFASSGSLSGTTPAVTAALVGGKLFG